MLLVWQNGPSTSSLSISTSRELESMLPSNSSSGPSFVPLICSHTRSDAGGSTFDPRFTTARLSHRRLHESHRIATDCSRALCPLFRVASGFIIPYVIIIVFQHHISVIFFLYAKEECKVDRHISSDAFLQGTGRRVTQMFFLVHQGSSTTCKSVQTLS